MPGKNKVEVRGIGKMSTVDPETEYPLIIRLLADNWKLADIHRELVRRDPETRVEYQSLRFLRKNRRAEVLELRRRLNKTLLEDDEIWLANKRQRILAMQQIFEDANRWTPVRVLETMREIKDTAVDAPEGSTKLRRRSIVVFEKKTDTMLAVLKQVREELGEDAGSQTAQSLADLVKMAEESRGLVQEHEVLPAETVDAIDVEAAQFIEAPDNARTAGDQPALNQQDGSVDPELDAVLPDDDDERGTPVL